MDSANTQMPTSLLERLLISANHFQIDTNRRYVVKNLLLAGQVGMLCGAPNTGKSAVIAAICSHVAMGRDFAGHRVSRTLVVYVAAEDPNGIGERAYPYMKSAPQSAAPFFILGRALNLSDDDEVGKFVEELMALQAGAGCQETPVVLDTMNLCIGNGDENLARDMGRAIGNAQHIASATRAHVLISHHTSGHDKTRPRGSTAMDGNVDTMLILHRADDSQPQGVVFITQEKQRSVVKGGPIAFQIQAFDAGVDSEGDPITVPMAVPYAPKTSLARQPSRQARATAPSANDARVADVRRVFEDLSRLDAAPWHDAKSIAARTGVPFNDVRDNPSLRKAVKRAIDALAGCAAIECSADGYRLGRPAEPIQEPGATLH